MMASSLFARSYAQTPLLSHVGRPDGAGRPRAMSAFLFDAARDLEIRFPIGDQHLVVCGLGGRSALHADHGSGSVPRSFEPGRSAVWPSGASGTMRGDFPERLVVALPDTLLGDVGASMFGRERETVSVRLREEQCSADPVISTLAGLVRRELGEVPDPARTLVLEGLEIALAAHLIRTHSELCIPGASTGANTGAGAENVAGGERGGARLSRAVLERVIRHIDGNLERDVSLAELSRVARLSRYHFCRAFRASTGASPAAYVEARRLERATGMMRDENISLSDIAYAVGFSDYAYFSRRFKRRAGESPARFRRQVLAGRE